MKILSGKIKKRKKYDGREMPPEIEYVVSIM